MDREEETESRIEDQRSWGGASGDDGLEISIVSDPDYGHPTTQTDRVTKLSFHRNIQLVHHSFYKSNIKCTRMRCHSIFSRNPSSRNDLWEQLSNNRASPVCSKILFYSSNRLERRQERRTGRGRWCSQSRLC